MFNRWMLTLIFNLVALSGNSAEVCGTLTECRKLKKQLSTTLVAVNEKIQDLQPSLLLSSDIIRDKKGHPRLLNYSSDYIWKHFHDKVELGALEYCASQGKYVPTIREFVLLASRACTPKIVDKEPCGAAGISETPKYGYQDVKIENADGTFDHIYYSKEGYHRPVGFFGSVQLWSSSTEQGHFALTFDGETGGIIGMYPTINHKSYAICAITQKVPGS